MLGLAALAALPGDRVRPPEAPTVTQLVGSYEWMHDVGYGPLDEPVLSLGEFPPDLSPNPQGQPDQVVVAASVGLRAIQPTVDDGTGPYYRLDDVELLLREVAPAEWVEPLLWIARCESARVDLGGQGWYVRAGAVGDGGNSLGAWQLWHGWFPAAVRAGVVAPEYEWLDIQVQARVAVYVRQVRGRFGGGGGWTCADLLGVE